jgi:transcriptional regulator with XRE-family HTH domain
MNNIDIMEKVRAIAAKSGLTQQQIGMKMGYPKASARQAFWRFLQSESPTWGNVMKFADAMGVDRKEFV